MKAPSAKTLAAASLLWSLCLTNTLHAQIDKQFTTVFQTILRDRLLLSPGAHKNHFIDAAAEAESLLTPALNSLIVSNISSFPLSSTTPGITFDFSSGVPVIVSQSLGPIFADRAETIGRGKINAGFNATFLNLTKFRGLETDKMRFTFTHKDLNDDDILGGLDSTGTEGDVIDVTMGSEINASIFAFYASMGVTSNLDVGIAVPVTHVSVSGTAKALISSYTYANQGRAAHFFGGTSANPTLETSVPYDGSATGIGDIAVRVKYCFLRSTGIDLGALLDVRIPSGKKEDFLGSGKTGVIVSGILSKKVGEFNPHINLGYEVRAADFQSNRVVLKGGFDQKVLSGVTFAFDFLGTFDVDKSKAIRLFPGTRSITDYADPTNYSVRTINLSDIPDRDNDNLYNLSAGIRYSPSSRVLFLANMLVPLNDGGLRSPVAPTIGLSVNL
jgi:hypothetical protein